MIRRDDDIDESTKFAFDWLNDLVEEDFTCYGCIIEKTCPYAYDIYNTNGDCICK